jgi:hypothetical protein
LAYKGEAGRLLASVASTEVNSAVVNGLTQLPRLDVDGIHHGLSLATGIGTACLNP